MNNSRVLQKDLPFDNLKSGDVLSLYNGKYIIDNGNAWHDGCVYGGSANGDVVFCEPSQAILSAVWDNEDWFKPISISKVKYERTRKSIALRFDSPLTFDCIESIATGVQRTLELHYRNTVTSMGWKDEKVDVKF